MKKFLPIIFLFITSCTGAGSYVETYQVGEYSIFITGGDKVNDEYQKVCSLYCSRSVKGFVNYRTKEMWSIQSLPVVMHEFKHIVEGHYHKKPVVYK